MHIHSTRSSSEIGNIIHKINRILIPFLANYKIACSDDAGKFGFGKKYKIINNGINIKEYHLDKVTIKQKFNHEFQIEDGSLILGHVGRFLPVKNHRFILSCYEYISKYRKAALILVGDGPLKNVIKEQVQVKHLKNVFFLGERKDIPELLNYFDMMIFPSFYEGVPLVPLEAQAAKLKVLCSDKISNDVFITKYAKKCSLNDNAKQWANEVLNFLPVAINDDIDIKFAMNGYDIKTITAQLVNIWK